MNLELKRIAFIEWGTEHFEFSLVQQHYVMFNGQRQIIGDEIRTQVVPGSIDVVKAQIGEDHPITKILELLWTADVIARYVPQSPPQEVSYFADPPPVIYG